MAFLIGFFLEATLGMLGFWFLEVASLLFVYMLANYLLSGHMFPLDMLDGIATGLLGISLGDVVKMLPFEYTAYFPAAIWLGKISGPAMYQGLLIEAMWVIVMAAACRLAYDRGSRHWSAVGG